MEDNKNSMIQFQNELQNDLNEEASDVEKYMNLAENAKAMYPDCGYDSILRTIAHEEQTHHKHIRAILDDIKKKETESKWM